MATKELFRFVSSQIYGFNHIPKGLYHIPEHC